MMKKTKLSKNLKRKPKNKTLKPSEKEKKEAALAVKKAKKELREAEEATNKAQEEVIEAAIVSKGTKKKNFVDAARDLEKATYLAAESCESTEEAEFKIKEPKKKR